MTDSRLHALERAWEVSGSVEDEVAYLTERLRVGDLSEEQLELEVFLGSPAATVIRPWSEELFGAVIKRVTWLGRAGQPNPRDGEVRRLEAWSEWRRAPSYGLDGLATSLTTTLRAGSRGAEFEARWGGFYEWVETLIVAGIDDEAWGDVTPDHDPRTTAVSDCAWWVALLGCYRDFGKPVPWSLNQIARWIVEGHWVVGIDPPDWEPTDTATPRLIVL